MAVYITENKIKEIKTYQGSLAGIQMIKDIRWAYDNDPEFRKKYDAYVEKERDGRFQQSIKRTRKRIQEVLEANLDDASYFLTLTFKENLKDYEKANARFNNWIRIKNKGIKYLAVKELQQRGAIHYHLIVFGCNDIKKVVDTWSYGYYFIKPIRDRHSYSIANYFTNYFTDKNQLVAKEKKIFSTSRNLKKPLIITREAMDQVFNLAGWNIDPLTYNWLQHDYTIKETTTKDYAVGLLLKKT